MNCLDFRRAVGAEPALRNDEIEAHARACPACTEFANQIQALDRRLVEALAVAMPARGRRLPFLNHAFAPQRRWALAASVLLAAGLAFGVWLSFPRSSLAEDVMAHVRQEPQSWSTEGAEVSADELAQILHAAGVTGSLDLGRVVYARSCWFRGHFVPHLVVMEDSGPIMLMLLPGEATRQEVRFSDRGYSGVILPAARGSVAVLARTDTRLDAVAERGLQALD
ncbi:MAG TPA: DUF3379 family protein [Steroidobacteraceae bacterium]|nr:DUF3379 family protein [Steroidobacteraceae bacterium]